ncbi:MAG: rhamnulokinase [Anaerolineae bacterium]|nr:rhamnulokinase [Anaerolineae bacterium]
MKETVHFAAIDLGAESGRVILGTLAEERICLDEIHRFANGPVRLPDGLHWDVLHIWSEIKHGIATLAKSGKQLAGIGLDTWGVDFALLDAQGILLGNPYHYRDARTNGMLEAAFQRVPRQEIFDQTGIQFMQINTLYQLLSMVLNNSAQLDAARTFLTIPDLFNYWLSGRMVCEFTNATTTQCYSPRQDGWALGLLERLHIPVDIFPQIVPPGTLLGGLQPYLCEELGVDSVPVIAPACHDTGSAVAAVPAEHSHIAWISSGTWSVMGTEASEPGISERTLKYNFTNEGGVGGKWRLSKNVMGLWIVQECRRTWARQGEELSYDQLTDLAERARPLQAVIDPDHMDFLMPGNMPERIRAYCERTAQPVLREKGAVVRCVLESIALKYRWVLERLEEIVGYRLDPLHIIGGGTKNRLLNQLVADATGRKVVTGPVEATAIGNCLMQAVAVGSLPSIQAGRDMVRRSFAMDVYLPRRSQDQEWEKCYRRLLDLLQE